MGLSTPNGSSSSAPSNSVRTGAILIALLASSIAAFSSAANAETVFITGANSGIGLEFTRQYVAKGWTIIATHRRTEVPPSLAAIAAKYGKLRIERLDVTNVEQVQALAKKLADVPIDVLINNAGVYNDRGACVSDDEGCPGDWTTQNFGKLRYGLFDTIMAVNVKGPLIVSEAFFGNVKASRQKKLVAIGSSTGSLTGEGFAGPGAIFYRTSKAALNRSMQSVASSVKADGVTVVILNPGPTLTEHQAYLKDAKGMLKTSFTVENMIRTIDKATIQDSGRFLRYDGATEPW